MTRYLECALAAILTIGLSGCNTVSFESLQKAPLKLFSKKSAEQTLAGEKKINSHSTMTDLIARAEASVDTSIGFKNAVRAAVVSHPVTILAKREYEAQLETVSIAKSQKDFQVSSTVYGGIEDVTDETAGVALVLSASRLVYDGGQLDNQISSGEFLAQAAYNSYEAAIEDRALEAARVWAQLERFMALDALISSRLDVLEPLIKQLEQVADAGIGDVSMVAAAQRSVSQILVAQMEVSENLELAKVNFSNVYGKIDDVPPYNAELISEAIPISINDDLLMKAPSLLREYYAYKAALAGLQVIYAKDNFTVGFETKVQRPFGGSGYDSDETIGFVARRTLFNGDKLTSEIKQAEAQAEVRAASLKSVFRQGRRAISSGQKSISSTDRAIKLALENAENAREEISYLRKQLVIGQSTLESVLAAEARLYDAESQEINFLAIQREAELSILATVGFLSKVFNIDQLD